MSKYTIRTLTNVYEQPAGFEVRERTAPTDTMEHCLFTCSTKPEAEAWVAKQEAFDAHQ